MDSKNKKPLIGGQAVIDLAAELKGRVKELYNVGDSYAPRSLHHAINEAHKYARQFRGGCGTRQTGDGIRRN